MRFLKSIVTVAALCATFASAAISPDAGGYYNLATADDLREFVSLVNGGEKCTGEGESKECTTTDPQPSLNARLTQNIQLVNVSIVSFNENGAEIKLPKYNTISPIQNFSGTFDGQGFSISGLYIGGDSIRVIKDVSTTDEESGETVTTKDTSYVFASDAGFIINLKDDAVIKDLRIVNSYFSANKQVGSLAARASGNVTIQGYQFSGVIKADSLQRKCPSDDDVCNSMSESIVGDTVGGVIGYVEKDSKLTISNLIVEGWITHDMINSDKKQVTGGYNVGGFIGVNKGYIDFKNCYSKILITTKYDRSVFGKINEQSSANSNKSVYCAGTGQKCDVKDLCNKDGISQTKVSVCREIFGENLANRFNTNDSVKAHGVTFEFDKDKYKLIAHITEWEKNGDGSYKLDDQENKVVLEYLEIPKEIYVDSVDFDREFSGKNSTIMLPFDIEPSKVTATSKCVVEQGETFEPLKFNKFNSGSDITYNETDEKYEAIAGTETQEISAHYPYLIDGVKGRIHFCGPVTLKETKRNSGKNFELGDWKFYGTYKTMLTTSDGGSDYESSGNLGRIYGFVGTEFKTDKGHEFTYGQFTKAGHNVRTREMRAYLIYSGNKIAPNAAPPYRNMNRAAPATTVLDLSDENLPNAIDVIVEEKEIVIPPRTFIKDTTVMSPVIVSTIKLIYPSAEDDDEENPEEGTTAIAKPFISPLKSNKVESWRDIKGRRLNGKPNVPGTYFKNGIPVIIK